MTNDRRNLRPILAAGLTAAAATGLLVVRAQPHTDISSRFQSAVAVSGGPILLVDAITVRAEQVQQVNTLSGQVEPYHTATIAAEVAERILRRPIQRGDRVQQNAVLASLFAETAQTALSQAQHALDQAIAARRQAETDYQRAIVETDANRQQARAQVNQALADRQRAQAQVAQAAAGERKSRSFTRQQEQHQAEDALMQARTDERLAKIEYSRQVYLVGEGAAPQQALDRAQATYEAAVAHRQSAEQSVSLATEGARQEDRDVASAQVSAAQAQVASAGQQVEQARAALRIANTRDTRLMVLQRQIDGLSAQEEQARDAVRQAQIALAKRTLRAPFAGRVLATTADAGDMVSPGAPIAQLGEIRRVKVTFAVPEASRPPLWTGQPITITADALKNRRFAGKITALGYQADAKSRSFPIEVTVNNPDEALLPNMVARLTLPVGRGAHRILIPSSAVAGSGKTAFVYVLKNGRARQQEVTLGTLIGNDIEVVRGLEAGDRIAATPQRLSDHANIKINQSALSQ
jgi:RND family efflux transporter MFP subunit